MALLPPNVHGRLVARTMRPRYITIHSTANIDATASRRAQYPPVKGKRSRNNPRFGRSGWVVWHFSVDDREAVQHLLPTNKAITPTMEAWETAGVSKSKFVNS